MINTGSDNGLVPGGTKPLPEPMLTYQFETNQILIKNQNLSSKISNFKMLSVKFPPYCSSRIVLMNSGGHDSFVPSAAWEEKLLKQGGIFQGMNTFSPHLIDSYLTDTVDGIMQHEI